MYKIKTEKTNVEIELTIDNSEWEKGVQKVYEDTKSKFNITGFRKGHAPRKVIEQHYGDSVFFEDTVNYFVDECLKDVWLNQPNLEPVSTPRPQFESFTKDGGLKMKIMFEVIPDFELGQYKGLTVKVAHSDVTDADVDNFIKNSLEQHAKYDTVEREVKNGDSVIIDFKGYIDDVAFDGGEAQDYPLEIGSHTFIDTFEDQLVGRKAGDEVDVNVTFPQDYGQTDFAGKKALFKVTVKNVREKTLPELNDKFVSDTTEFETVDEYRNHVREHIQSMRDEQDKTEFEYQINKLLCENTQIEIPESMIKEQIDRTVVEMRNTMAMYGLTLEEYLERTHSTFEDYVKSMRTRTEKAIKLRHIYRKLISENNLEVTDEELAEATKGMTKKEEILEKENNLIIAKLMKLLKDNNTIEYVKE